MVTRFAHDYANIARQNILINRHMNHIGRTNDGYIVESDQDSINNLLSQFTLKVIDSVPNLEQGERIYPLKQLTNVANFYFLDNRDTLPYLLEAKAFIVDFINFVASKIGIDYGMYVTDLDYAINESTEHPSPSLPLYT